MNLIELQRSLRQLRLGGMAAVPMERIRNQRRFGFEAGSSAHNWISAAAGSPRDAETRTLSR